MTVQPIRMIGDPVLRTRSGEIDPNAIAGTEVQALVDDLIDTMRAANGAGLAANQIGRLARIVVMEVNDNPRYPYKPRIPLTVAINPVIRPLDDELVHLNEGCLSVPLRGWLDRHVNVEVSYLDRRGEPHTEMKRGLTAATWQHEVDHLDGTLFIDRVADPTTLATWESFDAFQRAEFVRDITAFVDRVGS